MKSDVLWTAIAICMTSYMYHQSTTPIVHMLYLSYTTCTCITTLHYTHSPHACYTGPVLQMEPDSNVRVDHWLDGDTEMMSQINTAVSGIGVSGMDFGLSATDMGDSLPQLGSGFIPDSASQRGSILDTQQYLRSNLPSQASKFSNSTHHMERPRAGLTPGMSGMPGISGMSGSTRNMLLPVAESGLLAVGSSAAVLPIDSQLSLSSAGALAKRVGGGRYRGRSMTMVDEEDREEDEGGRGTGEGGSFVRDAASERDRFGEDSGDGGKVSDGERDAFSDSRLYSQGTLR